MQIVERIFPQIQLHVQASGRHSTVDPPLAQLPEDLRKIVLPEVGMIEWGYDWDQQELRIIAAEANDLPLLEAFDKGYDVHTMSLCDIFIIPYPRDLVNPFSGEADGQWRDDYAFRGKVDVRRTFSKRFIYRLLYGARPDTCTDITGVRQLNLDVRGLVVASENWLNAHPAIRRYQAKCAEIARSRGMIHTFMGRRRTLIETGDEAARQAMNHPMQGGSTDIYEEVIYAITEKFYPSLRFRWGMHDSHKWDMGVGPFRHDEETGFTLLNAAAAIVEQSRFINGHSVKFPATYSITDEYGKETKWSPTNHLPS
jgi:hypothetical protein